MFKSIMEENLPCWYELSWQEKPSAIILRFDKDFIKNFNHEFLSSQLIERFKEEFGFNEFNQDFSRDIGFDRVFKCRGQKDNFIEFLIKEPEYLNEFYTISASFTVFRSLLMFCEKETLVSFPQLMVFVTETQKGFHGGSLGGEISLPLKNWLMDYRNSRCSSSDKIKLVAYCGYNLYVEENGRFSILHSLVAGLKPCVFPEWKDYPNQGYEFHTHNCDRPRDQFIFLFLLAKLHDLARKGIK